MATVEDLVDAVQLQTSLYNTGVDKLKGFTAQYAAVDLTASGAADLVKNINVESSAFRVTFDSKRDSSDANITRLAASVPAADTSQVPDILNTASKKTAITAYATAELNTDSAYQNNINVLQNNGTAATTPSAPVDSATNPDATDAASKAKMSAATVVGDTTPAAAATPNNSQELMIEGRRVKLPPGAMPTKAEIANLTSKDMNGNVKKPDLRVKIRVPDDYLTVRTSGINNELKNNGGIIFPYTPSISYEHKADYSSTSPTHSNFAINFYQHSAISNITINGKFTVQNERDAIVYLATLHLLRALTKMRSGGTNIGDPDSGAPPPVCRLDAYGQSMLDNTPVAIAGVRVELPDNIDYFTLGKNTPHPIFGTAMVPVVSTISITCIPMFSRAEMQQFSVTSWLKSTKLRDKGLL